MEYIVFSYKKKARSEFSYSFGDHYKNNSKRESFDSLFFCEKSHICNKKIYKKDGVRLIMKPEALTEYFVQYMNSIVFCCNAKNQDPLYVKNNLTHKTWKYQNQLIDNFSSIYHHFLEVIDHYIQWNSVTEAELMQFGFCKVGVEEIFLIPYYIFSIVPETFEFVNLYGCAIKKKRIPVSSQELILGCLPYGIMLKEI